MKKLFEKYTRIGHVTLILLFVTFILSLVLFFLQPRTYRLFLFESIDSNRVYAEKRFLPKNPQEGAVRQFLNDLVLRPITPRLKPLFPEGTQVLSSFVRDKTLYVELSENALVYSDGSLLTAHEIEIFEKNIFTNFKNIKAVKIAIKEERISY